MSSTPETSSAPSHWEIPRDTDPLPIELLDGPPRYRCSEDGTRVYSFADIAAHDEQFHPEALHGVTGYPTPDEQRARELALDSAIRARHPMDSKKDVLKSSQRFLDFLRGGAPAEQRTYPFVDGPHLVLGPECFTGDGDEVDQTVISWKGENFYLRAVVAPRREAPSALHEALDRAWVSVRDEGGAQVMSDDDDEDVLEQLRNLTDDEVRRAGFVLGIVRALANVIRSDRHQAAAALAEERAE